MAAEFFIGAPIVYQLPAIPQPAIPPTGNGAIYFDSGLNLFMVSQNGSAFIPLVGGGGAAPLSSVLALGNTTGANDILVSTGQAVRGVAELTLASAVGSDLVLTGRGAATNLNQAGETSLDVAYTGVGRTSIIGALNALVDGTVVPAVPALSAVLAVGNTTGAFNVSVNTGQKVLGAAELTLDGTTVVNLQTAATTRWQVQAAGHLVPGATDNLEDIGAPATRARSIYAGTSVVVGATVTINGVANTIVGSTGLALSSAAGAASLTAAGAASLVGGTTTTVTGATGASVTATTGVASLSASAGSVSVTGGTTAAVTGATGASVTATTGAATLSASAGSVSVTAAGGGTATVSTAGGGNAIIDASGIIDLRIGAASFWQVNALGNLVAATDNVTSIGSAGANRPSTINLGTSAVIATTLTVTGTAATATGALSVVAGAASDLGLSGRGASTNLNQAGQTALNVAYTGVGRTSIIGALNALVDGTVTPTAPALSAVLAVGNTTGANNISVNTGQKILGAAELTLDGTTVLNLQTAATTRWQVSATGHLLPGTTDNSEDIGAAATNRIRTLYAGTSVVVGSTVTINGTTNTITSSANLTLDTAAAGTMNIGTTNAATINVGAGVGTTTILAAADVTISGDLTVNGTTTTINTTNLTVTDALIYANNGGANPSFAGMAWDQGAALDVIMDWNPTNARMEFGRFNTTGGTTVPSGPLTTLIDVRVNDLSLAGTAVTADAGLTVTATAAALNLAATGANLIQFTTNGASRWNVASTGHLLANIDNTLDIGATGATRPRRVYVGTEVVVGNTITIGSSTIASSTSLNITSAAGTGGGAGSILTVTSGAGDGVGAGGTAAFAAGAGGATGAGGTTAIIGGAGGATSGAGGVVNVLGGTPIDGNGGGVTLTGQNGAGTNRNGGSVSVACGNATGTGTAGGVTLQAGTGGTTTAGGVIQINAGNGGVTDGAGGAVFVNGGTAAGTGTGGQIILAGGTSPAGTGGEVTLQTGNAALVDRVRVLPTGLVGIGSGTPLSTLDVQGSFGLGVASISTSTTADATAAVYLVDATGGAVTLTLPTAASALRRTYNVKKTDSSLNAVTIDGAGAETIDGAATQTLIAQYESIMIVSDGTSWFIL